MKKVLVIGCPGAGKSTFSRGLRAKTGLPLYYLDMLWHKPDKSNFTQEEFECALSEILNLKEWIVDGNYIRTLEERLRRCDTVFLLNIPVSECLQGRYALDGDRIGSRIRAVDSRFSARPNAENTRTADKIRRRQTGRGISIQSGSRRIFEKSLKEKRREIPPFGLFMR